MKHRDVTPDRVAPWSQGNEQALASAIGFARAADHEILEVARRERRVVVTADLDHPRLVILNDASGPGVIPFRGGSYSDQEMLTLLDRVLGYAARLVGW